MTPAARFAATIDVLDAVLAGAALEQTLTSWARKNRYAGSKDRAAIRDHVFQAMRCQNSYAAAGGAMTGRGIVLGLVQAQGIDPEEIFSGQGYAPSLLSDAEKARISKDTPIVDDAPGWIAQKLRDQMGTQANTVLETYRNRAPIALRVNLARASVDKTRDALAQDGIVCRPVKETPTALIVQSGERRVKLHPLYADGVIELQDVSSQKAMAALDLCDGDSVLDYCAGGGGKALALAARNVKAITAHDISAARMADIPNRAARAGVSIDIAETLSPESRFDVVLVDAPCSGSGTWRRAPQAKWALTPEDLKVFQQSQRECLEAAAPFARRALAYATCSIFEEENETQAAWFGATFPEFLQTKVTKFSMNADGDGFFFVQFERKTPA